MQKRKTELEAKLEIESTDQTIDDLLQFREAVAGGLSHSNSEERKQVLEALQTKVTVSNGIAVVTCRLSGQGAQFELSTGSRIL